ncbi:MAG: hypothetical protein KatS3mg111_3984 [Pirellulaceae bacterium]|nr:MAG: hypothetical protein KatS3mg111_3984 [Pirellulaceae bacterium]
MSAAMASNTSTIYVNLLDEGVVVLRPTQGLQLGEDEYEVLPPTDYDPDDEVWEFPPGSIVRCIREKRDGEIILVARELVSK